MRKIEHFVSRDSCKREFRTKITTITGLGDIEKEINENYSLHDWALEYVACDGKKGQVTARHYDEDILFHFAVADIHRFSIDLDVQARWLSEVKLCMVEEGASLTFCGVGIQITARDVELSIQEKE